MSHKSFTEMSGDVSNRRAARAEADMESRKPWSTPLVIVSAAQHTENHNTNNTDTTTSGIPIGGS